MEAGQSEYVCLNCRLKDKKGKVPVCVTDKPFKSRTASAEPVNLEPGLAQGVGGSKTRATWLRSAE